MVLTAAGALAKKPFRFLALRIAADFRAELPEDRHHVALATAIPAARDNGTGIPFRNEIGSAGDAIATGVAARRSPDVDGFEERRSHDAASLAGLAVETARGPRDVKNNGTDEERGGFGESHCFVRCHD